MFWNALMAARARTYFEDVEVGRTLVLHACERGVADRTCQVRLAFFDRRRFVGRGHGVLAEARIIQLFDVHGAMLARPTTQGRRQFVTV